VALIDTKLPRAEYVRESESLRDRLGKQLSTVRMLSEATEYELGIDPDKHMRAGDTLMQTSMTAVALVWNHATLLHEENEGNSPGRPPLVSLRQTVAQGLSSMADALEQRRPINAKAKHRVATLDFELTADESDSEYARNTIARYNEVQGLALALEFPD